MTFIDALCLWLSEAPVCTVQFAPGEPFVLSLMISQRRLLLTVPDADNRSAHIVASVREVHDLRCVRTDERPASVAAV